MKSCASRLSRRNCGLVSLGGWFLHCLSGNQIRSKQIHDMLRFTQTRPFEIFCLLYSLPSLPGATGMEGKKRVNALQQKVPALDHRGRLREEFLAKPEVHRKPKFCAGLGRSEPSTCSTLHHQICNVKMVYFILLLNLLYCHTLAQRRKEGGQSILQTPWQLARTSDSQKEVRRAGRRRQVILSFERNGTTSRLQACSVCGSAVRPWCLELKEPRLRRKS